MRLCEALGTVVGCTFYTWWCACSSLPDPDRGDDPSASSLRLLFYEGCSLGLRSSLRKDGEHVSYRYIQGESRREGLVSISDSGGFSVHVSIDSARGFFCCHLLPIWQTRCLRRLIAQDRDIEHFWESRLTGVGSHSFCCASATIESLDGIGSS